MIVGVWSMAIVQWQLHEYIITLDHLSIVQERVDNMTKSWKDSPKELKVDSQPSQLMNGKN